MRYAAEVHEVMALRDQQTLAKYIWLLEQKIQKKMNDQHALKMEACNLGARSVCCFLFACRFDRKNSNRDHTET